ncbi:hypothetical protein [Micromonospora chokoriensis]|uniref:hypothetical protein n=1 Tax=Micromonospora chokoriensis TaxID=356851 RepID=UPI0012F7C5D8|nr:hypothetical protein [Micromonospora chokoriensis]
MDDLYAVRFSLPGGVPLDELGNAEGPGEDEDEEPDVKTTFAHFGLAYYQACVLEHEIVNLLSVARIVEARRDAERLLSDPWDEKFKKTMGALIKQLEPNLGADPELAADLTEALRQRNYLAHTFWRERADDFADDSGRAQMIAFLIEARRTFESVNERLTLALGTPLLREWGVTPAAVDAWYRNTIERVVRGELRVPRDTIDSVRRSLLDRIAPPSSD